IPGFKVTTNNVCYKSPLVFRDTSRTATNSPIVKWQWNFGDGNGIVNSNGLAVTHTYNRPGSYGASLTVTDAVGCVATGYGNTNANARGAIASFNATSPYGGSTVPLNTTVTFINTSIVYPPNEISYLWQYGNLGTSTG